MSQTPRGPDTSPGFQLWLVTLAWQRAVTIALRPHGLTHVQFVLLAGTWWLTEQDGPPTQRELARHAGSDPMMVSQVLRRLEGKGLVKRTADPIDARAKRVGLTRAGGTRLRKAMPTVHETDADFFSPVSRTLLLGVLTSLATTTEDDHEHDSDDFADPRGARERAPTV